MNANLEQTKSIWMQVGEISSPASLSKNVVTDVCVVGAGIAGMTTAYLLLREGKSVVVLDDGPIGGGQTQRTTAHLSNAIDDRYVKIEEWHGLEGMRMAAESHTAATVTAHSVVVATNSPFNDSVTIHTKQSAYMSYVLGFEVPKGSVTKALYWDTENPYHYVRLQALPENESSGELLIVGGEDHKTGQSNDAEDRYRRIEEWTRKRFPASGSILYRWSGQVLETIDGLAFIGRNPLDGPNVYIATGDSGQGMTHGTIAGVLLTDLILERQNPWATLYDPSRKTLAAAGRPWCRLYATIC